jgi:hypothetical protein
MSFENRLTPIGRLVKSRIIPLWHALAMVLMFGLATPGFADDPVPAISPVQGMWRWSFTNADGVITSPTLRVDTEDDGSLSGTTRFRTGSSAPVTNLTFVDGKLSFQVVRIREGEPFVTRYTGELVRKKIAGKIVVGPPGEEQVLDWNAAQVNDIDGVWRWRLGTVVRGRANPIDGSGGSGTARRNGGPEIRLTLKRGSGDKLSGKLKFDRTEQELLHGRYVDDELKFETTRVRSDGGTGTNRYWGTFVQDAIIGRFTSDFGGVLRTNSWRAGRVE